ncbi:MAG: twin-arginine translocation signal domain-containing protein, partial [Coriobacteriales bacterium]|nr:twin-arginine translocation signal domain-containing protein [Coriobacteriales bacterium]
MPALPAEPPYPGLYHLGPGGLFSSSDGKNLPAGICPPTLRALYLRGERCTERPGFHARREIIRCDWKGAQKNMSKLTMTRRSFLKVAAVTGAAMA